MFTYMLKMMSTSLSVILVKSLRDELGGVPKPGLN